MTDVFDVAKYILEKQGALSTWKLQKLCYYAQAWSLAWSGVPLFQEDFQAWTNGPVCPALYQCHSGRFFISANDLERGNSSIVTHNQADTINKVLEFYGDKEPFWLREQTHCEKPWIDARGGLPDEALCQTIILKESMGDYYGRL